MFQVNPLLNQALFSLKEKKVKKIKMSSPAIFIWRLKRKLTIMKVMEQLQCNVHIKYKTKQTNK